MDRPVVYKKSDTKEHTVSDTIHTKCPGKANIQEQKVNQWLLRDWEWE